MNFLTKLLLLPVAQRQVPQNSLPNFQEVLRGEIESSLGRKEELSAQMLERLVLEAYQRAASEDGSNIAKNLAMYVQIEKVAAEVAAILNHKSLEDGPIKTIVQHYSSNR